METAEERLISVINQFDDHIKKTFDLLDQSGARYDKHINKLSTMLEQSESRIDRTNEMISMLAKSTANLEHTITEIIRFYNERIVKIIEGRDQLMKDVEKMVKAHEEDRRIILELQNEKLKILQQNYDKAMAILEKNSNKPVINVDNNQN